MTASLARQNEKLRLATEDIAAALGRMDNVLKVLRGHGLDAWVPLAEDAIKDLGSACTRLSEARYALNAESDSLGYQDESFAVRREV